MIVTVKLITKILNYTSMAKKSKSEKGFALIEFMVILIVVGVIAGVSYAILSRNESGGGFIIFSPSAGDPADNQDTNIHPPLKIQKPPSLQNLLGIDFGPYSRSSQVSGDFIFSKSAADQAAPGVNLLFYPFGQKVCATGAACKTQDVVSLYGIKLDTDVLAAAGGQVISLVQEGDVFSFKTVSNDYSGYSVDYAYIYKSTIKEGQFIKAGDIIGRVSPYGDRIFGRASLGVTSTSTPKNPVAIKLCPFDLIDSKLKPPITAAMYQFVSNWNAYIGNDVHGSSEMVTPGCKAKQVAL